MLTRLLPSPSEPIARQNGCSVVRTYCGHGANDLFHCAPNIPHYAKNKAVGTMRPGMTFTIEPVSPPGSPQTSPRTLTDLPLLASSRWGR